MRHKIALIPFPFDDLSSTKVRPILCLTDPIGPHGHVIVAFITSRVPADLLDTDLVIASDHPGFVETGLKVSSTVRIHRLMTVNGALLKRELGRLPGALD